MAPNMAVLLPSFRSSTLAPQTTLSLPFCITMPFTDVVGTVWDGNGGARNTIMAMGKIHFIGFPLTAGRRNGCQFDTFRCGRTDVERTSARLVHSKGFRNCPDIVGNILPCK